MALVRNPVPALGELAAPVLLETFVIPVEEELAFSVGLLPACCILRCCRFVGDLRLSSDKAALGALSSSANENRLRTIAPSTPTVLPGSTSSFAGLEMLSR